MAWARGRGDQVWVAETYHQLPLRVCVTAPEQVPAFLKELDRLFPRTWQARTFGARPRASRSEQEFFQLAAGLGMLRCYVLRSAGAPSLTFSTRWVFGHQRGRWYGSVITDQSAPAGAAMRRLRTTRATRC